jgi:hypothetical protein
MVQHREGPLQSCPNLPFYHPFIPTQRLSWSVPLPIWLKHCQNMQVILCSENFGTTSGLRSDRRCETLNVGRRLMLLLEVVRQELGRSWLILFTSLISIASEDDDARDKTCSRAFWEVIVSFGMINPDAVWFHLDSLLLKSGWGIEKKASIVLKTIK